MISLPATVPATTGRVLHWAVRYDLLVWLLTHGRTRAFASVSLTSRISRLVNLSSTWGAEREVWRLPAAKGRVGAGGKAFGIDASSGMIARATAKAARAGTDVCVKNAVAEALPFPAAQFDVVSSTLMLHHLPRKVRQQCAREIRRVLKPDGL